MSFSAAPVQRTLNDFIGRLGRGPRTFLGEELSLGLTPALTLVDAGTLGSGGLYVRSIQVPGTGVPLGVVYYLRSFILDGKASNGVVRPSNGESTVFYNGNR